MKKFMKSFLTTIDGTKPNWFYNILVLCMIVGLLVNAV